MSKRIVPVTFRGETHIWSEWARITGIGSQTLRSRYFSSGWTLEETLTTPLGKKPARRQPPKPPSEKQQRIAPCTGCRYWRTFTGSPSNGGLRACHYANDKALRNEKGARTRKVDGVVIVPMTGRACPHWTEK